MRNAPSRRCNASYAMHTLKTVRGESIPEMYVHIYFMKIYAGRASTGDQDVCLDGGGANNSTVGSPPNKKCVGSVPGWQAEEEAGGKVVSVQATEQVSSSQEERWLSMTKTEKRRLWLHRRRSGEFYFRSEFKGLVHAVREKGNST